MNERELRVGNYYDQFGNIRQVNGNVISELEKAPEGQLWCKPIPLTEEWLIKMGFVSNPYQDRYELNEIYIDCDKLKGFLQLWESRTGVDLKTVHQLQNLYYALCGEELTIKK